MTENTEQRKISDIILSLEEKVLTLIKIVAANDLNNKLILDRLNKMLTQSTLTATPVSPQQEPENKIIQNIQTPIEISKAPIATRRTVANAQEEEPSEKKKKSISNTGASKIPVGQRITDHTGKDLFMADVLITNVETDETSKCKTNAGGKWQAYLPIGKYTVYVSKIIDPTTKNKIECLQEIEITPQMKALHLPIAIIKR